MKAPKTIAKGFVPLSYPPEELFGYYAPRHIQARKLAADGGRGEVSE